MMSPYTTSNKLLTVQKQDINILPYRIKPLKPAGNIIYLKTYFLPHWKQCASITKNNSLMQCFSKWGSESEPRVPRKADKNLGILYVLVVILSIYSHINIKMGVR